MPTRYVLLTSQRRCKSFIFIFIYIIIYNSLNFQLRSSRYNDEMGFNYARFLQDLEALPITKPLYEKLVNERLILNAEKPLPIPCQDERDIVLILGKIKAKVVRERVNVSGLFGIMHKKLRLSWRLS